MPSKQKPRFKTGLNLNGHTKKLDYSFYYEPTHHKTQPSRICSIIRDRQSCLRAGDKGWQREALIKNPGRALCRLFSFGIQKDLIF